MADEDSDLVICSLCGQECDFCEYLDGEPYCSGCLHDMDEDF